MVSGKKVKLLRINNGWSQEQLAELANLGIRTIQRIESDEKCSLESKMALCSVFSISPNELLDDSEFGYPLQSGINWDGVIGVCFSVIVVIALLNVSGGWSYFFDFWSVILVVALPFGLSCISSGVKNSTCVYSNISWLILLPVNFKPTPNLLPCVRRIIFYVYMSGVLGGLISVIAIFSNLSPQDSEFWPAMAIVLITPFNALIFAELILRPLKHKYEQIITHHKYI